MHCSIVIPTWNEQSWLPRLLERICNHYFVNEIIVADNNSTDETVSIAKKYGCLIVPGGLPGYARNIGASLAHSEVIIFIDADTIVPYSTLTRAVHFLSNKEFTVYHCPLVPLSSKAFIQICYCAMDWYFRLLCMTPFRQGVGSFIAVRRSEFLKLGGFRVKLKAGEDADFIRRAARVGRVLYDTKSNVFVSARRFRIENPIWFATKTILWALLRQTSTEYSIFDYCWRRYPAHFFLEETPCLRFRCFTKKSSSYRS